MAYDKKSKEEVTFDQFDKHSTPKLKLTYFQYESEGIQLDKLKNSVEELSVIARKMYVDNLILKRNLNILSCEEKYLKSYKQKISGLFLVKNSSTESGQQMKKRRNRRNAVEINRLYKCSESSCGKSYGSEGTLAQHYKTKHPQIQYQKMLESSQSKGSQDDSVMMKQPKDQ